MWEGGRSAPARRALLLGGGAALLALAGGCGIRLEDDAPALPLLPTRTPVPAEDLLVALGRDTDALARRAAALTSPTAAALAVLHRRQHAVLRAALAGAGVPVERLDAPPTPSGTATATSSATGSPAPTSSATPTETPADRAALAAAEAAAAAGAARFGAVAPDLRGVVAAVHAQRWAAASVLTGRGPTVPGDPVSGSGVRDLAERTEAAAYLLEVVAARSRAAQRERAERTLAVLRATRADQGAAGDAPPAVLGRALPFPVRTADDAARLAREALTALRDDHGRALAPLVAEHGGDGVAAATRWLGAVEAEGHRWGVALQPFPGLA